MIKYFETHSKWNWVDDNNLFVGFSSGQCCCEDFGSFVTDSLENLDEYKCNLTDEDLKEYSFDPTFFEDVDVERDYIDCGGAIAFKAVHETKKPLYLILYNYHNGYYAHGFEFTDKDGKILQDGCL